MTEDARAEAFAKQADRSRELALGHAQQVLGLLTQTRAVRDAVAGLLSRHGIHHQWDGTALSIMLPDGTFGASVDLLGPRGHRGLPPNLQVGSVTTGDPGSQAQFWIEGESPNYTIHMVLPEGARGEQGPPEGSTVLNGTGAPDEEMGKDGDFYIDTAVWNIYGPKADDAWPSPVSMVADADERYQLAAQRNTPGGYAGLDEDGLVSLSQLPVGGEEGDLVVLDEDGKLPELDASQLFNLPGAPVITRVETTSAPTIAAADAQVLFDCTGTFTLNIASPGDLRAGTYFYVQNSGAGDITVPASDGRTNWLIYPGEIRQFYSDGVTLRSIVHRAFYKQFTASGSFIKPPGYTGFLAVARGGGGGGGKYSTPETAVYGGWHGEVAGGFFAPAIQVELTMAVTIGAGGVGASAANTTGGDGGHTSFGTGSSSIVSAAGGAGGRTIVTAGPTTTNAHTAWRSGYSGYIFENGTQGQAQSAGAWGFAAGANSESGPGGDAAGISAGGGATRTGAKGGDGGPGDLHVWGVI